MSTTACPIAPECRLASAYRDLEGHIMDCANMARITDQIASDAQGLDGKILFAICQTMQLLEKLQATYGAAFAGVS